MRGCNTTSTTIHTTIPQGIRTTLSAKVCSVVAQELEQWPIPFVRAMGCLGLSWDRLALLLPKLWLLKAATKRFTIGSPFLVRSCRLRSYLF